MSPPSSPMASKCTFLQGPVKSVTCFNFLNYNYVHLVDINAIFLQICKDSPPFPAIKWFLTKSHCHPSSKSCHVVIEKQVISLKSNFNL